MADRETLTGDNETEYKVTITKTTKRIERVKNWLPNADPTGQRYDYVVTDAVQARETEVFKQILPAVPMAALVRLLNPEA